MPKEKPSSPSGERRARLERIADNPNPEAAPTNPAIPLADPPSENFAAARASGLSVRKAAMQSGMTERSAYRCMERPGTKERIAYLRTQFEKQEQEQAKDQPSHNWQHQTVTRDSIIGRLASIAFDEKQDPSAVVRATMGLAKIFGMLDEDAIFYGWTPDEIKQFNATGELPPGRSLPAWASYQQNSFRTDR